MAFTYDVNKDYGRNAQILAEHIFYDMSAAEAFQKHRNVFSTDCYNKVRVLISGVSAKMREDGFAITPTQEDSLIRNLELELDYKAGAPETAFSSKMGSKSIIYVNAGHDLVAKLPSGGEMLAAVRGLLYHELGHILFTSFPTLRAWQNSMSRGSWFPKVPQNINSHNGVMYQADSNSPEFKAAYTKIMSNIANALEDGYIENELMLVYPGAVKQALATINAQLMETIPSVADELDDPEGSEFSAIFNQILNYSKYQTMNFGNNCPDEIRDVLESLTDIIDDARVERHPEKRFEAVNYIGIEIYPYLKNLIDKMIQDYQQQQSNQQNQQGQQNAGGPSGSSGSGSGSGGSSGGRSNGSSSIPQDVLNKILQDIADKAQQQAQNGGVKSAEDSNLTSEGIANASKSANKNKDLPNSKNSGANGAGGDAGSGSGGGTGANSGDSSNDPAQRDFDRLVKQASDTVAKQRIEDERLRDMNNAAKSMPQIKDVNKNIVIKRATQVAQSNIDSYNKNSKYFERIASDLTRSIKQILKDRREGGRRKNLVMGRRFEANHYCLNDDYRDFSKIKWPTESPTLSFGVLVDESGSTSGECIEAATKAAIVLELFASKERGLDIKHIISGYTTSGWSTCEIRSYSEPAKIDNQDLYRITGMNSSGGTPTCAAMNYMRERLNSLRTDLKIMIVISDGESGDNVSYDNGTTLLKNIIEECRKDKIMVIAAGIGRDRDKVGNEFGQDNFLDVSDLELMPITLADIIKRQLWV